MSRFVAGIGLLSLVVPACRSARPPLDPLPPPPAVLRLPSTPAATPQPPPAATADPPTAAGPGVNRLSGLTSGEPGSSARARDVTGTDLHVVDGKATLKLTYGDGSTATIGPDGGPEGRFNPSLFGR